MINQTLEQFFGSKHKLRLVKFFVRNEGKFTIDEISKTLKINPKILKSEMPYLEKSGIISTNLQLNNKLFWLDKNSPLYSDLRGLVFKFAPAAQDKIKKDLIKIGNVKLAVLTGIFKNKPEARVDLLLVGKNLSEAKVNNFIKNLEAEVCQPVRYTVMTDEEFDYRTDMCDKFLGEILKSGHEKLINKLKI